MAASYHSLKRGAILSRLAVVFALDMQTFSTTQQPVISLVAPLLHMGRVPSFCFSFLMGLVGNI